MRQLQFLKDDRVDTLLGSVWGTVRESAADKLKMIADYKTLMTSTSHQAADVEWGRAVFAKTCMKCHILYGVGGKGRS